MSGGSQSQIGPLLQQALACLQRRDVNGADAVLTRALSIAPNEPNALQLLGLVRRDQQRDGDAEQLFHRSLAILPRQAHTLHNLGDLLADHGRFADAIDAQRSAIAIERNYPEAHFSLGRAQQSLGFLEDAERSFRNALRARPTYEVAKHSLAAVLIDQGRGDEAETILRRCLADVSNNPKLSAFLKTNLALALNQQRRHDEALAILNEADAEAPDRDSAEYLRGITLLNLNRNEDALDAFRAAIKRTPWDARAHSGLNQLLYRTGRDEEFLRSYDDAIAVAPQVPDLPLGKAEFLMRAKRYDEAVEFYERAARLLPGNAQPQDRIGISLARAGRIPEAVAAHEAALAIAPDDTGLLCNYADTLLRGNDPQKALEVATKALLIDPFEQYGLALKGLAQRLVGDERENELNDYANLVQSFAIDAPDGYADIESFNAELNHWLDTVHSGKREFIDQSLRGGTQTLGNLFGAGFELPEKLRTQIDRAIDAYISRLKNDGSHPLLRRRKKSFAYAGSWSARLHDQGFHANHIHVKGWLSSAYYVSVPTAAEDPKEKQGWLKFGEPDFELGLKEPVRHVEKPVAGKLVLFPSYMWHGTNPFHSAQARTTVAFDAVPR